MELKVYATVICQEFDSRNLKLEIVDDMIVITGILSP